MTREEAIGHLARIARVRADEYDRKAMAFDGEGQPDTARQFREFAKDYRRIADVATARPDKSGSSKGG